MKFLQILLGSILLIACQGDKKAENSVTSEQFEKKTTKKNILFFGDSITAGYQLDLSEVFPAIIQERLDSLGLNYNTINAGLSGETTASGVSRVDWVMKNPVDIFILELGANDGLRGVKNEETEKNIESIISKVKAKYPECQIVLAGMMLPPNLGQDYTDGFMKIYPKLAKKHNLPLIEFLLYGVAGNPALNLEDGIHPNAEGHRIVTENVWKVLSPLL